MFLSRSHTLVSLVPMLIWKVLNNMGHRVGVLDVELSSLNVIQWLHPQWVEECSTMVINWWSLSYKGIFHAINYSMAMYLGSNEVLMPTNVCTTIGLEVCLHHEEWCILSFEEVLDSSPSVNGEKCMGWSINVNIWLAFHLLQRR